MKYRDYINTYQIPFKKLSRKTGIHERTLAYLYNGKRHRNVTLKMAKSLIEYSNNQITWEEMIEDYA